MIAILLLKSDTDVVEEKDVKTKIVAGGKKIGENISGLFNKKKKESPETATSEDPFETIKKLSELKDMGIISQEEFEAKKAELLSKI